MQVAFLTPSYHAAPAVEHLRSCLATQYLLCCNNIPNVFIDLPGDPYITKARNRLASEFLHKYPMCDKAFFTDDDVGWKPEDALRILQHDEDVVCGIYPKKSDVLDFPVEVAIENEQIVEKNGLYKASLAPTGFLCIKRSVLERLKAQSGSYVEQDIVGNNIQCWDFFRNGFVPDEPGGLVGRWWGEDYFFSILCRHNGIDVWIDPDVDFTHRGGKAWKANFRDSLSVWLEKNRLLRSGNTQLVVEPAI